MKHTGSPRTRTRQKGVAAVEMAIMLPLLVLVFTGMVEYGRLMWHYDALAKATRDAARYLAEEAKPITAGMKTTARNMVIDATAAAGMKDEGGPLVAAGDIDVDCDPSNCTSPNTVTVSIHYDFVIGGWVPVIGRSGATITSVTLSPHTTMRYMR